jgi:RNA polymerase sigma factor (sigma-70 family)
MATAAHLLARLRHLVRPDPTPESDAALLTRFARHRDEAAFAELVSRHGPMVLRLGLRLLADSHAAEDAFQATFLVLARRAGSIRRRQSVAAWLYGVAYRVALKVRATRKRRHEEDPGVAPDPADPHPDPLAHLSARELLLALEEEVQRLPEVYRLPVVLVCLEGLSQEEAAQRLGWTAGSVKGRLERGRKQLHRQLARRGLALTAALGAAEAARGAAVAAVSATTVEAATMFAAGKDLPAGLVSAHVVAVAKGALRVMCVKQFVGVGVTTVLLLGLLGAGTGQLVSAFASGGQAAPGGGPGVAKRPAQQGAAGKKAESPDLLRALRERILIEEQKLTQEVEAVLDRARTTAPDDPEAARRVLRRALLQVWDHPDIGERVRDSLLARLLAAQREHRGAATPPGAFAWGEPHKGLRVGIAQEGPGRAGGVRLALALENMSKNDMALNLGTMLANGKKQYPRALALTLTNARGGVRTLRRTFSRVAGRLDPFVVPLPAGCRYTLRYDLADIVDVDQDQAVVGVPWTPGRHRAALEFVGKAVERDWMNQDSSGLALMPYWTGTVRSGELVLVLPTRRGGKDAPGGR